MISAPPTPQLAARMMVPPARRRGGTRIASPREWPGGLAPVDLRAVVDETLALVAPELAGRRAAVRVDVALSRTLPPVVGEPNDLKSIFVNLLLNARDAMRYRSTVRITGRTDGKMVVVTVADEGHGFAPKLLPRVQVQVGRVRT